LDRDLHRRLPDPDLGDVTGAERRVPRRELGFATRHSALAMEESMATTDHQLAGHAEHAHAHPGPKTYIQIAVILGIITVCEVAIVYIEFFHPVVVPLLLVLSSLKFALVALYYMHLKFDPRLYSGLIAGALSAAATVFIGLILLMAFNGFLP